MSDTVGLSQRSLSGLVIPGPAMLIHFVGKTGVIGFNLMPDVYKLAAAIAGLSQRSTLANC